MRITISEAIKLAESMGHEVKRPKPVAWTFALNERDTEPLMTRRIGQAEAARRAGFIVTPLIAMPVIGGGE